MKPEVGTHATPSGEDEAVLTLLRGPLEATIGKAATDAILTLRHQRDAAMVQVERMETALRALEQWDMLSLDKDGHGVSTADAPWARALISAALSGRTTGGDDA